MPRPPEQEPELTDDEEVEDEVDEGIHTFSPVLKTAKIYNIIMVSHTIKTHFDKHGLLFYVMDLSDSYNIEASKRNVHLFESFLKHVLMFSSLFICIFCSYFGVFP